MHECLYEYILDLASHLKENKGFQVSSLENFIAVPVKGNSFSLPHLLRNSYNVYYYYFLITSDEKYYQLTRYSISYGRLTTLLSLSASAGIEPIS